VLLASKLKEQNNKNAIYTLRDKRGFTPIDYAANIATPDHYHLLKNFSKDGYSNCPHLKVFICDALPQLHSLETFKLLLNDCLQLRGNILVPEDIISMLQTAIRSERFNIAEYIYQNYGKETNVNLLTIMLDLNIENKKLEDIAKKHPDILNMRDGAGRYPLVVMMKQQGYEATISLLRSIAQQNKEASFQHKQESLSPDAAKSFLWYLYGYRQACSGAINIKSRINTDVLGLAHNFPNIAKYQSIFYEGKLEKPLHKSMMFWQEDELLSTYYTSYQPPISNSQRGNGFH